MNSSLKKHTHRNGISNLEDQKLIERALNKQILEIFLWMRFSDFFKGGGEKKICHRLNRMLLENIMNV